MVVGLYLAFRADSMLSSVVLESPDARENALSVLCPRLTRSAVTAAPSRFQSELTGASLGVAVGNRTG